MKRILVSSVIIALVLIIPLTAREVDTSNQHHQQSPDEPGRSSLALADVGGTGDDAASTLFMSRTFSDMELSILNTYATIAKHNGTLNLTEYLVPGWTLYNATMMLSNLTAALEREVVGVNPQATENFKIEEMVPPGDVYFEELGQGFYNQSHNGSLLNYSIRYRAINYDPDYYGYAFHTIRSDNSDSSTNLTSEVNVTASIPYVWLTLNGNNANLSQDTVYWTMIDGTNLVEYENSYPEVFWSSEDSAGEFNTSFFLNNAWAYNRPNEALLNYTYTPWDLTTNSALVLTNPQDIAFRANSTSVTDSSVWSFSSSDKNITLINFDSNQSVYIYHNLTLCYEKSATAQTDWNISTPGGNVVWNQTLTTSYPSITEIDARYVNFTRMTDWTPEGLYNGTSSTNHDNYTVIGAAVRCANMTNGTWTLQLSAPNYVQFIDTYDSFDDSVIYEAANILVDMDINSTISDGAILASTGSANLTIYHEGESIHTQLDESVVTGKTHNLWDIDTHNDNGTFTIEVYWANGTEAGYLAKEIVVFYPTTLEAADYNVDAYTDNSFSISVYYNDTFTPQPLTGASAVVEYSFDGGANTSMTDEGDGSWTATILTTAKAPGTYSVTVYAEGFAIENQTAVIWATLIHETLPLTCAWSMPLQDNITYVEQTNLTVRYQFTDATPVLGAKVNVTIAGMSTWQLHYDPVSEIYWMQFNGSDFTAGFDTFILNVSAWKTGHEARFNNALSLTVRLAPTTMTLDWSSTTIDYLGQIDLTVNYTCDADGLAVPTGTVIANITIDGNPPLSLNLSGDFWTANLTGVFLDLGPHSVVVQAWAYGYEYQINNTYSITVNNVTTDELTIVWNPADVTIEYIDTLNLTVEYTYGGTPVPSTAIVNITIDGNPPLLLNLSGNFWTANLTGVSLDLGSYSVVIQAWAYGYEYQINNTYSIAVNNATTDMTLDWSSITIDYLGQIDLTVNYTCDANGLAVPTGTVIANITIDGNPPRSLNLSGNFWTANLTGLFLDLGPHSVVVQAWAYGYEYQFNDTFSLTVQLAPTTMTLDWSSTTIDYLGQIDLTVNYTCDVNGLAVPTGTVIANITIDGNPPLSLNLSGDFWTANLTGLFLDLGPHSVVVQAWAYGYEYQINNTFSLIVQLAPTTMTLDWSSTTIDYLGQIDLTVNYTCDADGLAVPTGTVIANITIDGNPPLSLNLSGNFWTANLTGLFLDLGPHSVVVQAWAYGYEYRFNDLYSLTVNNVTTDELSVVWNPANVTIEYIDRLNLTVDYAYGGIAVPATAIVNVTINGHSYDLNWSAGGWEGSIPGGDIGPDIWEATISAWLYGYEPGLNITSNINITLAANSFYVFWEPSDLDVTYVEQVNLTVIYTYDYQPIPGATVTLTLNGTTVFNFTLEADNQWHLLLNASVIDLGNWNANVTANKTGYDIGTMSRMMLVRVDPCTATPNWLTTEICYTHQTDLNVTLLDSLGHPMESTIVNATYEGVNYTLSHVANGVYRLLLNGSDGLGTYPIQIFTFIYGFVNRTVDIQLDILETPTSLDTSGTRIFEYSEAQGTVLYNDGWLVFNVRYEDNNSIVLTGATLNVTIDGQVYAFSIQPSGNYTLTLYAIQLGIGTHSGSFLADIYGYETRIDPFSIDVELVPAHIEVSLGVVPSVMFLNDSAIIRFDYINDHTGMGIAGATTTIFIWPNNLAEQQIDTGRFEVNISSFSLTLTDHVLNVTLGHVNYTTAQFVRVINIRAMNTRFTAPSSFGQYENETVVLAVNYTDIDHGQFIHWASVNATIEGTVFHMLYAGEGIYALNLHITWSPGTYQISFAASAVGCASNYTTAQLAVSEKAFAYLTLSVIGAIEGQSGQISATLRENDTENPVHGATIYYKITIVFTNGTVYAIEAVYTHLTNDEGVASFAYLIPASVDYLEIVARFAGTTSIWGTDTFLSVPVSPSILSVVMAFILTPPGMYIVLGFVVLAVVASFYNKRIKPKKRAAMDSLERQLQDFADLETLRHFMAVYLDRGTCVFYHPFVDERIQPDLISGFIAAITSVYGEIKGDGVRGTLEEIQYHGLRLNSYSGKYVIGILILEGEMTKLLRERLRFFIEVFEKHHEMYLEDWDGLVDCFDPEWVVSNLTGSFNYAGLLPHKFGKKRKVSKLDGKILDLIGTRRNNRREFNLRDLIKPVAALMGASEARALDKLLAMEDKGLIEPIGIQTVLQRQGLGLANGEDETITAPVSIPEPTPPPKAVPAKSKPAKKIEPMDIGRIAAEHEPIKPREGTGKPDPGKPRFIDETEPKDIDKSSPKLATAPTAEAKAKPTEKKKAPKEELSEADKFLTEVIILLAKEKKEMDKSD